MSKGNRRLGVFISACMLAGAVSSATAKTERSTTHSLKKVWPTAVRHIRVDENFAIVEKDRETGYIVFEVKDEGKVYSGALEVVPTRDGGHPVVLLKLSIHDRPSYMEDAVLDRLLDKLYREHGDGPDPDDSKPAPKHKPKSKTPPSKPAPKS